MNKTILVTGSSGLIGSEAVRFYCKKKRKVLGIDNDFRKYFFGSVGSTDWNKKLLEKEFRDYYQHRQVDIRDENKINDIFKKNNIALVIHAAAQPSHDWAAKEPLTDFTINALGTHILLEATRKYAPNAPFIFTSTNKVYGDNPNKLPLEEKETRYELPKSHKYYEGIDEKMSIDECTHSIFGVSKTAADLMVQEYGRYFGMKTAAFRGGCLTGPAHSSAQLHGFLAYLVSSIVEGREYTIFGYKGKQVRDNIHSHDVITAFDHFYRNPRSGEIYNIGGSRYSNTSVIEAIEKIENIIGIKAKIKYESENRIGDHIWYISDMSKFKSHYPEWNYTYDNQKIIQELCDFAVKTSNSK